MTQPYLIDARRLPEGEEIVADVCIIGGGAAGLTVHRELMATGLDIAIFEAGGLNPRPEDQELMQGEILSDPYPLKGMRLRYFGGTANHWGGQCPALEPKDFERLSYIPGSGWPYGYEVLLPYYHRAAEHLGLGTGEVDAEAVAAQLGKRLIDLRGSVLRNIMVQYNRHRFGLWLTDQFETLDRTRVFLSADLMDLRFGGDDGRISTAEFTTIAGNTVKARARYFVLATGAIETARLLLSMNRERPAGIGNAYDQVGRYWQEHLWYASGMLVLAEPLDHDPLYLREHEIGGYDGYAVRAHLGLTPEAEAKHKLSGFRAEVFGASEKDAHLWRLGSGQVSGAEIAQILGRIDDFAAQRLCDVPRAPTVVTLMNYFQMRPYADNRVTLGETRDRFGRPLPALDFRVRPEEHASLRRTHEIIAEDVARRGIGRLRVEIDPEDDPPLPGRSYGAHHIGTARMSDDPKEGVTDRDARVHETDNLYIAGSAIYPVCGWQNPTFTIVATSIKLADHLKRRATLEGVL